MAWLKQRAGAVKKALDVSTQAQRNLLTLPADVLQRVHRQAHNPSDASDIHSLEDALAEVMDLRLLLRDILPHTDDQRPAPRDAAAPSTGTVMGVPYFTPATAPPDADTLAEYLAPPLARACTHNDARAVQLLLSCKGDVDRSHMDVAPLQVAAEHGDIKLWKILRAHSTTPVSAPTLAASCRNGDSDVLLDICDEFIQADMPLPRCDCAAHSALLAAARKRNADALRLLLHVQADPNEAWEGGSVLACLCEDDDLPGLRLLLREAHAALRLDAADAKTGATALKTACDRRSVRCVALLLAHKADPNYQGSDHADALSPLHLAAAAGSAECVMALIHARADVEQVTGLGINAATIAEVNGHDHVLALLTHGNAEVTQKSDWPIFPDI